MKNVFVLREKLYHSKELDENWIRISNVYSSNDNINPFL